MSRERRIAQGKTCSVPGTWLGEGMQFPGQDLPSHQRIMELLGSPGVGILGEQRRARPAHGGSRRS